MPDSTTISKESEGLQMWLAADAANVAVVRHALAGMATELGMDEAGVADLKTIVTEACMNVVVHAYREESGEISVRAVADADGIEVTVSDEGSGIRPEADPERDSLRLGLSLIAALSNSFAISGGLGRGTEVRMRVPFKNGDAAAKAEANPAPAAPGTKVIVEDDDLLAPVLARMVGALGARQEVTVERLSDAVLLTDAIASAAPAGFADGRVQVGISDGDGGIEISVGPMQAGAAERMRAELDLPGGGSLAQLADEVEVKDDGDGESLVVRFLGRP